MVHQDPWDYNAAIFEIATYVRSWFSNVELALRVSLEIIQTTLVKINSSDGCGTLVTPEIPNIYITGTDSSYDSN